MDLDRKVVDDELCLSLVKKWLQNSAEILDMVLPQTFEQIASLFLCFLSSRSRKTFSDFNERRFVPWLNIAA